MDWEALVSERLEDLRVKALAFLEVAIETDIQNAEKAAKAGVDLSCEMDPCPYCTAAEELQVALLGLED